MASTMVDIGVAVSGIAEIRILAVERTVYL
jgi:hypothetical protein